MKISKKENKEEHVWWFDRSNYCVSSWKHEPTVGMYLAKTMKPKEVDQLIEILREAKELAGSCTCHKR